MYMPFRKLFVWAITAFLPFCAAAQENHWTGTVKAEPAVLEVFYDYLALDTVIAQSLSTEMVLQIGERWEKFFDRGEYIIDSTVWVNELQISKVEFDEFVKDNLGKIFEKWWKDRETNCFEEVGMLRVNSYTTTDCTAVQDWNIDYDDTLEICGYICRKATCTFRGRDWTAWYAPEMPFQSGPWKLHGLPGLILKATDAEGLIAITAFGIRPANAYGITRNDRRFYSRFAKKMDRHTVWDYARMKAIDTAAYEKIFPTRMIDLDTGEKITFAGQRFFYCPLEKSPD